MVCIDTSHIAATSSAGVGVGAGVSVRVSGSESGADSGGVRVISSDSWTMAGRWSNIDCTTLGNREWVSR